MWQAKHEKWCPNQDRYAVTYHQDAEGNTLDSDPACKGGIVVECVECEAGAEWVES